ncbi:MAG: hypothetical protein WKF30_04430 [Pyrinomonadaceae bacterium]
MIGYSDQIEQLMQAANVMISKLGGLTTFEAFACRLPIVADATTAPMPQEAGAAEMIERRGAGVLLKNPVDIVPVIRRMVEDSPYYAGLRAAAAGLALPDSTQRIVEDYGVDSCAGDCCDGRRHRRRFSAHRDPLEDSRTCFPAPAT